jgi:hypothetical protein
MAYADELAALEAQIDARVEAADLLALATEIDELGRRLATELAGLLVQPERAAPLKPVLLRLPAVHTRALLRAAEKLDDAGSPRRAARVLIEALRKAFDANLVDPVADALAFVLDAFAQRDAAARLRELTAPSELGRRELRARHLAIVDELPSLIEWSALDDELGFD